jgi:hypothetical protein
MKKDVWKQMEEKNWQFIGDCLAIYRRLFGNLSAIIWQFIGDYLAIYRRLFGNLSAIVWQFIGDCLTTAIKHTK